MSDQDLQRQLQATLVEIGTALERAKDLANQLQTTFTVLGRTYIPFRTITQGGRFDHEEPVAHSDWDESDEWRSSGWPDC